MASITSSGIGSGLDIQGLVQKLIAAERQPTELRIARQEAQVQSRISAFGSLKSSLSTFNDQLQKMNTLNSFLTRSASSADETLLTVAVDEKALPATYNVEVSQLAQAQKLQSGAFASSADVLGTGTLSIAVGANSFNVTIDSTNNTLAGIRDAINDAVDNTGVAATIVNGDGGSFLILSGENTGSDQSMIITQSGGDGGLSVLEYDPPNALNSLTEISQALDAQIMIDGFAVTSGSNTVTGAIDGVTLNLVAASVGVTTAVNVSNDTAAVSKQISDFVDSYNVLIDTFDTLTSFDADTKSAAPLLGDSSVRNIREQLRRVMSGSVTDIAASFKTLNEIGIDTAIDGKLTLDSVKLDAVLATEFSKVGQLFANSDGFAVSLVPVIDHYIDTTDGLIAARVSGLDSKIDSFAKQREALDGRIASLQTRLLRQFNALDSLVGQLTSTSNFLAQQLQNLPSILKSRN